MQTAWNTTLVELFGPVARLVTVQHLVQMQSGIADVESVPGYEEAALFNTTAEPHDPIWDLQASERSSILF